MSMSKKITTAKANLFESQRASLRNRGEDVEVVCVGGVTVGHIAKNKYGVWIGHFDPQALLADGNPFVNARIEFSTHPSVRGTRTKRDVVKDVAAQNQGEYKRHIDAGIALRQLEADGHLDRFEVQAIYRECDTDGFAWKKLAGLVHDVSNATVPVTLTKAVLDSIVNYCKQDDRYVRSIVTKGEGRDRTNTVTFGSLFKDDEVYTLNNEAKPVTEQAEGTVSIRRVA